MPHPCSLRLVLVAGLCGLSSIALAQPQRGPGGRGGPSAPERELVAQFDVDHDGRLDDAERAAARAALADERAAEPEGRRRFGRGGPGRGGEPTGPGPRVERDAVATFPDAPLFDPSVVRTFFIDFADNDWETELADFYNTDVDVPATLTVDGSTLDGVGVHFRGASSYFMVPAGGKRSFNLALDHERGDQRLYGAKTINLLNSNGDPSFLSTVLYSHLARPHLPAPRANLVHVVVNGESWGVFVSVEQFDKDFVRTNFPAGGDDASAGHAARWKVKGRPNGNGGLDYVGADLAPYRERYEIKTRDDESDWNDLIELCRVLDETPLDELEDALAPLLDLDGVLWFLALDTTLVNSDGYWVRASDYSLYKDPAGVFHVVPHDMNEAFGLGRGGPGGPGRGRRPGRADRPDGPPPGGPDRAPRDAPDDGPGPGADRPLGNRPGGGGGGGRGEGGTTLDPLVALDDPGKPLRSRLLAVPHLREQYLRNVRTLAQESMDWNAIGPFIATQRALIEDLVRADTRKGSSYEAFDQATSPDAGVESSLRTFFEQRSAFLLAHPAVAALDEHRTESGE
ncbi:MAG: CotH kinase family protein [Phycisphaerales bacterium]|nr:CotH kinase family protein [Phycisphaerales bacterium]